MKFPKLLLTAAGATLALAAVPAGASAAAPGITTANISVSNLADGTSSVSAFDDNPGSSAAQTITVYRGGVPIATAGNPGEGAVVSGLHLQPGDSITLDDGGPVETATYDGRPQIDPVAPGDRTITGKVSPGSSGLRGGASGCGAYTPTQNLRNFNVSGGGSFSTTLGSPAIAGGQVAISEQADGAVTSHAPGVTGTYEASTRVFIGAPCGGSPIPTSTTTTTTTTNNTTVLVVPQVLPLIGHASLFRPRHHGLRLFFRFGLTENVTLSGPGRVFADIYVDDGTAPALASAKKKHKKHRRLLGRTVLSSSHAGTVAVNIKANKAARKYYRHAKRLKVIVLTSVKNTKGVTTPLNSQKLTLKK